jgi:DNA-binding NarL/FixJ family response regulator
MSAAQITVLLADDHPLFREGIKGLLLRDGRFDVVAEAADGARACALLRQQPTQLAVLDHSMPQVSGLEVVRSVRAELPDTRFAILSSFASPLLIAEALRAGADGYLLKEDSPRALADGLARLAAGECVISASVDPGALREARNSLGVTQRERDVLAGVVEGRSAAELAASLDLSPRTVETYRNQLVAKFGARNAVDLVRRAAMAGFLTTP